MYSELVKRLRERSVFLFPCYGEDRSYDADLMCEAADAIEELSHGTKNGLQCAARIIVGSDWRKIDV